MLSSMYRCLIATICCSVSAAAQEFEAGLKFKPPLVPIEVSLNHKGELSVEIEGKLVGGFSAYGSAKTQLWGPSSKTLTILNGESARAYRLGDREFAIKLPRDLGPNSRVEYGSDGNITIRLGGPAPPVPLPAEAPIRQVPSRQVSPVRTVYFTAGNGDGIFGRLIVAVNGLNGTTFLPFRGPGDTVTLRLEAGVYGVCVQGTVSPIGSYATALGFMDVHNDFPLRVVGDETHWLIQARFGGTAGTPRPGVGFYPVPH